MNHYPTIRIEGSILAGDVLEKLEERKGQKPADFGLNVPVKDEIARAWADAQDYWRIFQKRTESLSETAFGTTETRNFWIGPLLQLIGYQPEVRQRGEEIMGKNFAISHRDNSRDGFPIHVMGCRDSLDKKRTDSGPRMSPHGLVQEYLNLTEHLYAIVTNGLQLRLLRDSSRLVKLSYLEFDLDRMFSEGHFTDFALFYRLLHATRMPVNEQTAAESYIELYHQDSLDAGSRIRDGLSQAVEDSIKAFANGFLNHPANDALRERVRQSKESGDGFENEFYRYQLHLIYRLLFLMVIEERDLIFPSEKEWASQWDKQPAHIPRLSLRKAREIYYNYYSVNRLRNLAGKRYLADAKRDDYWISLRQTFCLFEQNKYGVALGIRPLAGDLFCESAVGILNECSLDNSVVMQCLANLTIFEHPETRQKIRVNYASLNVEEFGSVYEGLLEYDPVITRNPTRGSTFSELASHTETNRQHTSCLSAKPMTIGLTFGFKKGEGRSSSGSHYTPDELVTPLIKHSLDYLLEDRVKIINSAIKTGNLRGPQNREAREELVRKHLLSLTVCDVACGSGHILLNAARRIATECAIIIEEEEQPSPTAFRRAIRQVICNCIYGVDLNPLAVELCKVALWLEAHNPNEPLNFLDHHIKCGNAIVGLAHQEELERGIPEEAFKALPGDDKEFLKGFRNRNKAERQERLAGRQLKLNLGDVIKEDIDKALVELNRVNTMPESTVEEIEAKKTAYGRIGHLIRNLRFVADIQVSQFYVPKIAVNKDQIVTDEDYFKYLRGEKQLVGPGIASLSVLAHRKRFFHWFLEFPQVMANGGFGCILGNPPFLGGGRISTHHGSKFLNFIHTNYSPAGGQADLVVYFIRRNYSLIGANSFVGSIATNSVSDGASRVGGFDYILERGGRINFAIKSIKWPGLANLYVSLFTLYNGRRDLPYILEGTPVNKISAFFDDTENVGDPYSLHSNLNRMFIGSSLLGEGFIVDQCKISDFLHKDPQLVDLKQAIFPLLNGRSVNDSPTQKASQQAINFFDLPLSSLSQYRTILDHLESTVLPERASGKQSQYAATWWKYKRPTMELYESIKHLSCCFVLARITKHLSLSAATHGVTFTDALYVLADDRYSVFAVLQSNIHNEWARQYSGTLKLDLRYGPTTCFESFPFPTFDPKYEEMLMGLGSLYHDTRKSLMLDLQLGLTKTYNQFHNQTLVADVEPLEKAAFEKKYGKETWNLYNHLEVKKEGKISFAEAVPRICELRRLHKQMDEAVLAAYGWDKESPAMHPRDDGQIGVKIEGTWPAIDLRHDFYEVDYLPENDRVRYTIHPDARKEILKRLLLLNHKIYAQELAQGLHDKKKSGKQTHYSEDDGDSGQVVMEDGKPGYGDLPLFGGGKH